MTDARTRATERLASLDPAAAATARALARRRGEPCPECLDVIRPVFERCEWTCDLALLRRAVDEGKLPAAAGEPLVSLLMRALDQAMDMRHPRSSKAAANAAAEVEGCRAVVRLQNWTRGALATHLVSGIAVALSEATRHEKEGDPFNGPLCAAVLRCCDAARAPEDMEPCRESVPCGRGEGHDGQCGA